MMDHGRSRCHYLLRHSQGSTTSAWFLREGSFLFTLRIVDFHSLESRGVIGGYEKESHSTPHLELMNMLESVLKVASTKQRVLCYCDCDPAVRIAIARYSETANKYVIQRLREFDAQCCIRDLSVRFCWKSRELPLPKIADAFSRGKVDV